MTNQETLMSLASRVEEARGDSDLLALECDIACVIHGGEIVWKQANGTMEMHPARKYPSSARVGGFGFAPVEAVCRSLDAAMTLVPEGCWLRIDHWPGRLPTVSLQPIDEPPVDAVCAVAATPALALCAAALRSRLTNKDSQHAE